MAKNRTPFIITTAVDLAGLRTGLSQIQSELAKFKATGIVGASPSDVKSQEQLLQALRGGIIVQGNLGAATEGTGGRTKGLNKELGKTKNALEDVGRRVFVWGSMAALIFGAIQNVKEFYDSVIQVNTAMAELRKILPTETDFAALKEASFDLSIKFGQDPLKVLNILRQFGQAGLSAEESVKATNTALLALNTTGADFEQTFNAILGANRIFNIGFNEMATVIDKVQRVQADFAVEAKDLIASIQAIGPAITVFGGDIDDLFGSIAALGEAARISGKEAANSLKRVFSRLGSKEGIGALEEVGVAVFKSATEYRNLRDILNDLGKVWPTLTSVEQANLAITLAQVRQYPKLVALLNNWDRAQEALQSSMNASGDATSANQRILDSYAKQLEISKAKLTDFFNELLGGDGILGDTAGKFTQLKIAAVDSLSTLSPALIPLLQLGTGVGIAVGLQKIINTLLTVGATARVVKGETQNITNSFLSMTRTANVAGNTVITTLSKTGIALASISAITIAIVAATAAIQYFNREQIRTQKIIEESSKAFKEFKKTLEAFNTEGKKIVGQEATFNEIKNTLIELDKEAASGGKSITEISQALAGLFLGIQGDNLTEEQLSQTIDKMKLFGTELRRSLIRPFNDFIDQTISKVTPSFTKLQKAIEEGTDISEQVRSFGLQFTNLGGILTITNFATEKTSAFVDQIIELRKVLGVSLPVIDLDHNLDTLEKTSDAFLEQISIIQQYNLQLDALAKSSKTSAEANTEFVKAQEGKNKAIESAVGSLDVLLNKETLLKIALGNTNAAIADTLLLDSRNEKARALKDATDAWIDSLRKEAEALILDKAILEGVNGSLDRLRNLVVGLQGQDLKTTVSVDFNVVSFLAGLKKVNSTIVAGALEQLKALEVIENAFNDVGIKYDAAAKGIQIVDATVDSLSHTILENAKGLKELEIELKNLKDLQQQITNFANRDPEGYSKIQKRVTGLVDETEALLTATKENNNLLDDQVRLLARLKKAYVEVVETNKQNETVLENQTKLTQSFLQAQVSLNKLKFGDNLFKSLSANESIYKDILGLEKELVIQQAKREKLDDKTLETKLKQLDINYELAASEREITTLLDRSGQLYDQISSGISDVSSVFEDLFLNQEKFFDELSSTSSFLRTFERAFSGIGQAVKKANAQIIADLVSQQTKGIFVRPEAELSLIENRISDLITSGKLSSTVSDPFIQAGKEVADKIRTELEQAIKLLNENEFVSTAANILSIQIAEAQAELDRKKAEYEARGKAQIEAIENAKITADPDVVNLPENLKSALADVPVVWGNAIVQAHITGAEKAKKILSQEEVDKAATPNVPEGVRNFPSGQRTLTGAEVSALLNRKEGTEDITAAGEGALNRTVRLLESNVSKEQKLFSDATEQYDTLIRKISAEFDNKIDPLLFKSLIQQESSGNRFAKADTSSALGLTQLLKGTAQDLGVTDITDPEQSIRGGMKYLVQQLDRFGSIDLALAAYHGGPGVVSRSGPSPADIKYANKITERYNAALLRESADGNKYLESVAESTATASDYSKSTLTKFVDLFGSVEGLQQVQARQLAQDKVNAERAKQGRIAAAQLAASLFGDSIGYTLAKASGRSSEKVGVSSNVGTGLGSIVSLLLNSKNPNPLFGIVGGLVGGIFGGLFGPKEKEEIPDPVPVLHRIEENTAKLVETLSAQIFNAPSNFSLPSGQGFGGPAIINNFYVSGNSLDNSTVNTISSQIEDIYSRTTQRQSILG